MCPIEGGGADRPDPREREARIRARLGIPQDARRVLVLAESTHWDPNWMFTSEQYFRWRVRRALDRVVGELIAEPQRVFGIECIFFLRMYWERVPENREVVQSLVNEGRLRMTGSGITTPDTLLPGTEALLRDYLLGQEWLRENGMEQEPSLAYFPDSFGHAPTLPSLLKALGFDYAAITRIDGMFFVGCDYEMPKRFPRPGSSAALLAKKGTQDFVWRGPDGATVLCHWNAHTYGQGDLLAHSGVTRVLDLPFAVPNRSEKHVAKRVAGFVRQLEKMALTPYLLCPSGFDFSSPIKGLCGLLERYNRCHFGEHGTWVVNAGFDDYMDLVDCHREVLPVIELDPNPYWTGFYAARPSLKAAHRELVDRLDLAERLAVAVGTLEEAQTVAAELAGAWDVAAVANHHDFITGTAPDRVYEKEQRPWLEKATALVEQVVERLSPAAEPAIGSSSLPAWRLENGLLDVETETFVLRIDAAAGGAIVDARDAETGATFLRDRSNDIVEYEDSGGLWRMGHEFKGGRFRELGRVSSRFADIKARERGGILEVEINGAVGGEPVRRWLWLCRDSAVIRMRSELCAGLRRTVTVRFLTGVRGESLFMNAPAGVVERARDKWFCPTYWPASSFAHVVGGAGGPGVGLLLGRTGSVSCNSDGSLELVVARNAIKERAFGFLPIPGHPARGHDAGPAVFDYALVFTKEGDWQANRLDRLARERIAPLWLDRYASRRAVAAMAATTDRDDVFVEAVKPASRGNGWIVRLTGSVAPGSKVCLSMPGRHIRKAWLCDARERDLCELEAEGNVSVPMPGAIASVRVVSEK